MEASQTMHNVSDYILIIHTGSDIIIEEDIDEQFDIYRYTDSNKMQFEDFEFITKQEFNERLDQMLSEY
jgi:hypothetical protein